MKRETIQITFRDKPTEVVLRSSTVGDGSYHGQLIAEGNAIKIDGSHKSYDLKNAGLYLRPHCQACVESPEEVRDMSLDEFIMLDERELDAWAAASDRLNHHWWQAQADFINAAMKRVLELDEEAQKKTGMPLNGSVTPTTETTPEMDSQHSSS